MAKKKSATKVRETEDSGESTAPSIEGFEEDLGAVERIVRKLEGGELSLAQSLEAYEQGVARIKRCHRILASAQRRVELLTGIDDEGQVQTEPFDSDELSLEEKQLQRSRRRSSTQLPNQLSASNRPPISYSDLEEDDTDAEEEAIDFPPSSKRRPPRRDDDSQALF